MRKSENSRVLLGLLIVLAIGAIYVLLIRPQGTALSDARSRTEQAQAGLDSALLTLGQSESRNSPAADAGSIEAALIAAVPPEPRLSSILRDLQAIAVETGMVYASVAPSAPTTNPAGVGGSIQLSINASGTASAADAYLARLRDLPRMAVVEQISKQISTTDAGQMVSLQITASVFMMDGPSAAPARP